MTEHLRPSNEPCQFRSSITVVVVVMVMFWCVSYQYRNIAVLAELYWSFLFVCLRLSFVIHLEALFREEVSKSMEEHVDQQSEILALAVNRFNSAMFVHSCCFPVCLNVCR